MERNAHYALVGLISLLLFVGAIGFVVWLARAQFNNQYSVYDIDFKGPVRGLSSGGDVFFNGIKVGSVTKLSLDQRDPNRVVARVRLTAEAPVRIDSSATLEPQGVTGVNYIQITAGTPSKPLLKQVTPRDVIPVIPSTRGAFDSILEGGGTVLARTVEALDRVNKLLSDSNIAQVNGVLADVHDVTGQLKNQKKLLSDADALLVNLNSTSDHIRALSDSATVLVNGDAKRTLANLNATAEQLKGAATDARSTLGRLAGPTTDFATTGLPQLSTAIQSLQQAADSLNRVVGEVEENPRGVLTKAPAKTIEVKP